MHLAARFSLLLTLSTACFLSSDLVASSKKSKEPEKKQVKPVVVESELANGDLKDKSFTASFCKTYTFKMEKDKMYHVEVSSTVFPATLRLENSRGDNIGADTSRFGAATLIHRSEKTEDYTIVATTQNGGAVGKFTLIVTEVKEFDGKPVELKSDKGVASVTDVLLTNDPVRQGKRHRVYLVSMEKGKSYQIDMTSKAFDSYLFLESPSGNQLDANDDGGGYPSARIVHRANESGKFRIVTTYFGAGHGAFHLSIRQTD